MLREKKQYIVALSFTVVCLLFGGVQVASSRSLGVVINGGKTRTETRKVDLRFTGPFDVVSMKVGHEPKLGDGKWEPYKQTKTWYLRYGDEADGSNADDDQRVYVRFRDADGHETDIFSDWIRLDPPEIEVDVDVITDEPIETRFVILEAALSKGIDAFRYGFHSNLDGLPFIQISHGQRFEAVVSAGSGEKIIYMEFKNADGKIKKKQVTITYKQPSRYISEGKLIKGSGPAVYYYGFDGYLHPFVDAESYNSWYTSYNNINIISDVALQQYRFGKPVCLRQGTHLLKFKGLPKVYAVETGCRIRPIRSEAEAYILYGSEWYKRVREFDPIYRTLYQEVSYDITDDDEDIVDEDGDGLDEEKEADFGSSDFSEDTDKDGISDYEEIIYWFSDPNDKDSDNDGFSDFQEIKNGYSPIDDTKLKKIPANTYQYPVGSLVRQGSVIYYFEGRNNMQRVSATQSEAGFTSNNFKQEFLARPPIDLVLPSVVGSVGTNNNEVRRPKYRDEKGNLFSL